MQELAFVVCLREQVDFEPVAEDGIVTDRAVRGTAGLELGMRKEFCKIKLLTSSPTPRQG